MTSVAPVSVRSVADGVVASHNGDSVFLSLAEVAYADTKIYSVYCPRSRIRSDRILDRRDRVVSVTVFRVRAFEHALMIIMFRDACSNARAMRYVSGFSTADNG